MDRWMDGEVRKVRRRSEGMRKEVIFLIYELVAESFCDKATGMATKLDIKYINEWRKMKKLSDGRR